MRKMINATMITSAMSRKGRKACSRPFFQKIPFEKHDWCQVNRQVQFGKAGETAQEVPQRMRCARTLVEACLAARDEAVAGGAEEGAGGGLRVVT